MPDESPPLHLQHPDPAFVLTDEMRQTIFEGFDLAALEQLLAWTRPEFRSALLRSFQAIEGAGLSTGPLMIPDPVLQDLLHKVWAPRWEHFPENAWDDPDMDRYPGKEIARAHRDAKRTQKASEPYSGPPSRDGTSTST